MVSILVKLPQKRSHHRQKRLRACSFATYSFCLSIKINGLLRVLIRMVLKWKRLPYTGIIPSAGELVKKHNPANFVNRVVFNAAMTTNVSAESRVIRPLSLSFEHLTMEK